MQNFHNFLGTMLKNVRKKCIGVFCFTLFPFWRWYSSPKNVICSLALSQKQYLKKAPKTTTHQKMHQMVDAGSGLKLEAVISKLSLAHQTLRQMEPKILYLVIYVLAFTSILVLCVFHHSRLLRTVQCTGTSSDSSLLVFIKCHLISEIFETLGWKWKTRYYWVKS